MEGISKVMTLITFLTVIIISYTIFSNSQTSTLGDPNKEFVDTFLFDTPLKEVRISYENPGKKDLLVEEENNYRGTKISLGEYKFNIRGNVSNVTYVFEFPESLIKENDVNPETIELYTVSGEELIKIEGLKDNNSIILESDKLIPVLILADPNEAEKVSEEELYYNSKSKTTIFLEKMNSFLSNTKNQIFTGFAILGIIMTLILVAIEQARKPSKRSKDETIQDYIDHVRSEGLSDEEIIAELIERGIKASHAAMIVKRKKK